MHPPNQNQSHPFPANSTCSSGLPPTQPLMILNRMTLVPHSPDLRPSPSPPMTINQDISPPLPPPTPSARVVTTMQCPRATSPAPVPAPSRPPPLQRAQKSPQMARTCSTDASTVQSADHSQTSLQTCAMNPSLWNGGTAAWAASAAAAIQSIPPSPREPLPYFQTDTPRRSVMVLWKGKMVRVYLI